MERAAMERALKRNARAERSELQQTARAQERALGDQLPDFPMARGEEAEAEAAARWKACRAVQPEPPIGPPAAYGHPAYAPTGNLFSKAAAAAARRQESIAAARKQLEPLYKVWTEPDEGLGSRSSKPPGVRESVELAGPTREGHPPTRVLRSGGQYRVVTAYYQRAALGRAVTR